jgi:hypothetical protein
LAQAAAPVQDVEEFGVEHGQGHACRVLQKPYAGAKGERGGGGGGGATSAYAEQVTKVVVGVETDLPWRLELAVGTWVGEEKGEGGEEKGEGRGEGGGERGWGLRRVRHY